MAPRFRSRNGGPFSYLNTLSGTSTNTSGVILEEFFESDYPGSNNCHHITTSGFNGESFEYDNEFNSSGTEKRRIYVQGSGYHHMTLERLGNFLLPHVPAASLNWRKLESSSDFGLLQFVAELDDSIAIFTRKFWQQLSYGSLTFGVLPFLNDLQALLEQAESLARRSENALQTYEDEITFDVQIPVSHFMTLSGNWSAEAEMVATHRFTGHSSIPGLPVLETLDRLGFHPDVATAWDLVPLSFLVDYLLPVGDFLESISNRGWIKAVNFTGWHTVHVDALVKGFRRDNTGASGKWKEEAHVEIFHRNYLNSFVLLDEQDPLPDNWINLPSPRELFNMIYVLRSRR